jgi:hypothetical protein
VALIEAAFVTPVFFLLVFGVIEIGMAMNDNLALSHSTRAGSRVASASGNDLYADYGILRSIDRESSAIPREQIDYIVVYKAAGIGEPPTDTCKGGTSVTGVCNVYTPADFDLEKEDFGCGDSTAPDYAWCPQTRWVTLTSARSPDYVGVWMKVQHPWVTRMFGTTVTLTDSSVIQLEPRGQA